MPLISSHLRPFRDYDEKHVINFFAVTGVSMPFPNGTIVSITGAGFTPGLLDDLEMLGDFGQGAGQSSFLNNVQAQRYGALPKVTVANPYVNALGITLFDVAEVDENGEPLRYNPRKAAEMEVVLSGQAVPIVTKGIFQMSGLDLGQTILASGTSGFAIAQAGPITGGLNCYLGNSGLLCTTGITKCGIFLGSQASAQFTSGTSDNSFFVKLYFQ